MPQRPLTAGQEGATLFPENTKPPEMVPGGFAFRHTARIAKNLCGLFDQDDSVMILVTGIVFDHLDREPIGAGRGKDINAARLHRRARIVRSNTLLEIALFA